VRFAGGPADGDKHLARRLRVTGCDGDPDCDDCVAGRFFPAGH
jgi:hypothetical protein